MKMKNRSHGYDINKPRARHEYKYTKHKKCRGIMLICIKEHINNIWSSVYVKAKQRWVWRKKSVAYKKRVLQISAGIPLRNATKVY